MPETRQILTEIRIRDLNHSILFQFQVPGIGEGNILYVSLVRNSIFGGAGGDRTGIDREETDKPDPIPPLSPNQDLPETNIPDSTDDTVPDSADSADAQNTVQEHSDKSGQRTSGIGQTANEQMPAVADAVSEHQETGTVPSKEDHSVSGSKASSPVSSGSSLPQNYMGLNLPIHNFLPWSLLLAAAAAFLIFYVYTQKRTAKNKALAQIFLASAICTFTAAFCFLLYQYDNKYTKEGPQPVGGILALDESQLQEYPVLYLTDDWEYYGDTLLEPSDFEKDPPAPDEYVFIGQYGGFEREGSPSPHGNASYRLCLSLPDTPKTYMLELPEIFSSYQMYINEELVLKMGNADNRSYRPETGNRTVTFTAGGDISILIAVTDHSHLYSGMVYPPAFGQPEAVMSQSNMRLTLRSIVCTAAAVIGLFSLFIGITTKDRTLSMLYSLLCFLFIGYVGYPIWNTFGNGYYGKYTLENLCFCAMLTIAVLLQQKISAARYRLSRYVVLCGVAVCTITVVIHLALTAGALWMIRTYSYLIFAYEWSTAIFLTAASVTALLKNRLKSGPLFCGILIFDCTLVMDRLLPLFEPVVSGWFIELGSCALILTLGLSIGKEVSRQYQLNVVLEERARSAELLTRSRESYYSVLQSQIRQTNAARHDLRHHFIAVSGLIKNHQYEELDQYLSDYSQFFAPSKITKYCDNEVLNVLAHYFHQIAKQNNVSLDLKILLGNEIDIPNTDLSIVLSNLLENAMEACLQTESADRFINLCIRQTDDILDIYMKNSTGKTLQKNDHLFFAEQRNQRGFGLVSVSDIAKKYNGSAKFHFNQESSTFYSSVCFTLK